VKVTEVCGGTSTGNEASAASGDGEGGQFFPERILSAAILNATDVMLAYLDCDFNYLQVNPAFAATTGLRPAELLGKNHFSLFPYPQKEAIFRQVRDSGEPDSRKDDPYVLRGQPERGVTYWDWSLAPTKDGSGGVRGLVFTLRETTPYKRAELALAESEERFRCMAESSGDLIFQLDHRRRLTYASPAARTFGYDPRLVLGQPFTRFIPPRELPTALAAQRRLHKGEEISLFEIKVRKGDGTLADCQISATPMLRNGVLCGLQGVARDISDRKRDEAELLRLNKILLALGESRRVALLASDEETYLEEVCRIIVDDCGFKMVWIGYAEQDEARTVTPMAQAGLGYDYLRSVRVTWDDSQWGQGPTGAAIRTGRITGCRNLLTDPAFATWRAQAIKHGYASSLALPLMVAGRALGAMTIYAPTPDGFPEGQVAILAELAEDLTAGIVALRERRAREEAERALRRSELQLQTILDNIGEGLLVADLDSRMVYWNPAAVAMYGFADASEGHMLLHELAEINELLTIPEGKTLPLSEWPLARILRGESLRGYEMLVRRRKNHDWQRVFSYSGALARDRQGQPVLAIVVVSDVTERKKAEVKIHGLNEELRGSVGQLEELNRELARSNQDLQQFAFIVSHDLQGPLNNVVSFLQLLERRYRGRLDDKADTYIQSAVTGSNYMQRLLADLLEFSRVGGGKLALQPVDLGALLTSIVFNLQQAITEQQARVVIDPALPVVFADEAQMLHLLQNLIANALKFHGEVSPLVEVFAERRAGEWIICVRDNGIGIEPRYAEQIFLVFQRLHRREEYGGTGIGLAICKKIVERHGGLIWVESSLGQGATFCFSIPERRAEDVA